MLKKCLFGGLVTAFLGFVSDSQAIMLVQQWQGGGAGLNGLAGADAAIASRPADVSEYWSVIDFTDDPAGFAGLIPGSSRWPLATLRGQSGTAATANSDFAALISGSFTVGSADNFTFRTYADDGVRLRVDGNTVILDNTYHAEMQLLGSIFLSAGTHTFDLVFFEGGGEASLEFSVAQGSGSFGHVGGAGLPTEARSTPDAGATVSLFGMALGGLAWFRRRSDR